jgi:hypothetical protein
MNKLQKLHNMRERCGIVFRKSFRCKEAEKNIHLLDIDTFFEKFKKKLKFKGYIPSDDFDFNVIRHKYDYAERHHVGRSYSWKYFYSSTFTISDELIDYLIKHRFIFNSNEMLIKPKINTEIFKSKTLRFRVKDIDQREYIDSLLANGKTRREVVSELRSCYEEVMNKIQKNRESLSLTDDIVEIELLSDSNKTLKAKARWYKQCIFETRVSKKGGERQNFASLPYTKIIPPIQEGKNIEEAKEFLNQKIAKIDERVMTINNCLKELDNDKDKFRIVAYGGEKYNLNKNRKAYQFCLKELESGVFDRFFND